MVFDIPAPVHATRSLASSIQTAQVLAAGVSMVTGGLVEVLGDSDVGGDGGHFAHSQSSLFPSLPRSFVLRKGQPAVSAFSLTFYPQTAESRDLGHIWSDSTFQRSSSGEGGGEGSSGRERV